MPNFTDETIYEIFGNEDAENERPERLKSYFFRNRAYENLKANLPIRVLVGHKGVGKSALLKICHLEDAEDGFLTLWIRPNDVFSGVDLEATSFLALVENWKVGLSTLIVKKSLEAADLFEEAKRVAPITGGVRHLLSSLGKHFKEADAQLDEAGRKTVSDFRTGQRIRIYLDDLDRGWEARASDISNISALLNAVRDMAGEDSRIQFRIGLRTDVYHLVRTSDESTDKIEGNLIWLIWSNHEILTAMAKRVATYFGEEVDEKKLVAMRQKDIAYKLNRVIAPKFEGRGKWEKEDTYRILMTLVRKRPRDLVKLFYYAAKEAAKDGAEIIQSAHLQRVFERYSNERLRDVINEFKTELPQIENVLLGMRQTNKEREAGIGPVFDDGQIYNKLQTIISGLTIRFTNGDKVTAQNLARFLYKCDFITARFERDGYIVRKHFEENQLLMNERAQFGFKWEIHPAYRWALEPQGVDTLLARISLSSLD
ncbi:P-loop ATPase, Sll1717 family [Acidimangrovimonas sediminis]|uniref:P-loop ATPase, Sll1717 family n=1 Tax=Acidimangrovimonas sediminis TaxID=2056283 RepID=UPI0011AECBB0|nr:hypothetical protein [Acidimangrovimonas sediminis]